MSWGITLTTTHHFVCMMSKTTLFATLKKWRRIIQCTLLLHTALVVQLDNISASLSCEVMTSARRINFSKITPSVYSTRHLSSAEDKNFPFCPQLRTRKTYGKQMLFSKPSTMAYLTMVVLPSWQLLTQY